MGRTIPEPLSPAARAHMSPEALAKWDRWYRAQLADGIAYSRSMLWVATPIFLVLAIAVGYLAGQLLGWWR